MKLQKTGNVEVGGKATQELEMVAFPNKRAREIEVADSNFIPASTKGKGIATVVEEPDMKMSPYKRARVNDDATDANSVSTGKAVATENDKIGGCMCDNARENDVAAAKFIPLGNDDRSSESFANGDAASNGGQQFKSREIMGSSRMKEEQHSSPDHSPATESNNDSTAQEMAETLRKFAESAVKCKGRLSPRKRNELLNIQSATKLQETDFIEVGGKVTSQEHEIGMLPNKRSRENDAVDANFILASAKNTSIATVVEEPGMGMCSNKRARENDANSVSTGAIGKAGATGNDEIVCCMCNKRARENEEAAAARSTALGNDEID